MPFGYGGYGPISHYPGPGFGPPPGFGFAPPPGFGPPPGFAPPGPGFAPPLGPPGAGFAPPGPGFGPPPFAGPHGGPADRKGDWRDGKGDWRDGGGGKGKGKQGGKGKDGKGKGKRDDRREAVNQGPAHTQEQGTAPAGLPQDGKGGKKKKKKSKSALALHPAQIPQGLSTTQVKRKREGAGSSSSEDEAPANAAGAPAATTGAAQVKAQTPASTTSDLSPEEVRKRLEELLPRAADACSERETSFFLSWALAYGHFDDAQRDSLFDALLPEFPFAAASPTGNFVIQRLLDKITPEQRKMAVDILRGDVFRLACDRIGCRVVQMLLEKLPPVEQAYLVREIEIKMKECVEDLTGNHVVQTMIRIMDPASEPMRSLLDMLETHMEEMTARPYGAYVLQRLMERSQAFTHESLEPITSWLVDHAADLAVDRYGNYIIQSLMKHGSLDHKRNLMDVVCRNLVKFGMVKVSQHVVIQCIDMCTWDVDGPKLADERAAMMRMLLDSPDEKESVLRQLVFDRFGTFIIQHLLKCAAGQELRDLRDALQAMEKELRWSPAGKYILTALQRMEYDEQMRDPSRMQQDGQRDSDEVDQDERRAASEVDQDEQRAASEVDQDEQGAASEVDDDQRLAREVSSAFQ